MLPPHAEDGIATLYRHFPARENLIAACFETRVADTSPATAWNGMKAPPGTMSRTALTNRGVVTDAALQVPRSAPAAVARVGHSGRHSRMPGLATAPSQITPPGSNSREQRVPAEHNPRAPLNPPRAASGRQPRAARSARRSRSTTAHSETPARAAEPGSRGLPPGAIALLVSGLASDTGSGCTCPDKGSLASRRDHMSGTSAGFHAMIDILGRAGGGDTRRPGLRMPDGSDGAARLVFKSGSKRRRTAVLHRWLAIVRVQAPLRSQPHVAAGPTRKRVRRRITLNSEMSGLSASSAGSRASAAAPGPGPAITASGVMRPLESQAVRGRS